MGGHSLPVLLALTLLTLHATGDEALRNKQPTRHFSVRAASSDRKALLWSKAAAAAALPSTAEQKVTFAIRHRDRGVLERASRAVSDPKSPSYGRYWSLEEVSATSGCRASADAVVAWLEKGTQRAGLRVERTSGGQFVYAWLRAAEMQALFGVPVHHFMYKAPLRKTAKKKAAQRAEEVEGALPVTALNTRFAVAAGARYSVPAHLADMVDFVSGLDLPLFMHDTRMSPAEVTTLRGKREAAADIRHHRQQQTEQQAEQEETREIVQDGRAAAAAAVETSRVGAVAPPRLNVTVVEARDRAFQVHMTVLVDEPARRAMCGSRGANRATKVGEAGAAAVAGELAGEAVVPSSMVEELMMHCDDGSTVITEWESVATPSRHIEAYLPPVTIVQPFKTTQCTGAMVTVGNIEEAAGAAGARGGGRAMF